MESPDASRLIHVSERRLKDNEAGGLSQPRKQERGQRYGQGVLCADRRQSEEREEDKKGPGVTYGKQSGCGFYYLVVGS